MNFQRVKYSTFLILTLLTSVHFSAFSQKSLSLKNERIELIPSNYYISKVEDERPSTSLGSVIDPNQQRLNFNFQASTLNNYINRNLSQNTQQTPIILVIKELSLNESKKSNTLIEGKMQLNVQFKKYLSNGKMITIAETRSANNFTRSTNNFNEEMYERFIRQMTTSCLQYLNNWIDKNGGKSEAFAKGSRVIILPDAVGGDEDTIYFATRKLNWSDFRGMPPVSQYAAAVYSSIGYKAYFTVRNGLVEAQIKPQVFVLRNMSWAKPEAKNEYALAHEQVHFNIAKIALEHLKDRIKDIQAESVDELNSRIQFEYLEAFREMNHMQEAYDGESNHGLIEWKQHEWANKVEDELSKYQ